MSKKKIKKGNKFKVMEKPISFKVFLAVSATVVIIRLLLTAIPSYRIDI